MPGGPDAARRTARQLETDDLDRVVAIDCAHVGRSRRRFFERRMAAAGLSPHDFIRIGVMQDGALCGFAIARVHRGEFGHEHAVAVLDAVGVDPQSQERGIGQCLIEELARTAHAMGVHALDSQVAWEDQSLLRFFHAAGFELAPRLALERSVAAPLDEPREEI
jgi:ribosomal protein S18 acetylase RimI-like enzyme